MDCVKIFSCLLIALLTLCSLFCILTGGGSITSTIDVGDGNGAFISLIIIGAGTLLICILGFIGIGRKSQRLMWVFVGLASFSLVVLLGLTLATIYSDYREHARSLVLDTWGKEKKKVESAIMDRMQEKYHCCGIASFFEYVLMGHEPPKSCCYNGKCDDLKDLYRSGCLKKATDALCDAHEVNKVSQIGTMVVMLPTIGMAIWMAVRFKVIDQRSNY